MKKKIKIWDFLWKSFPHTPYKVQSDTPKNKSIMANKLPSTNLKRFLRRIKSPLTR